MSTKNRIQRTFSDIEALRMSLHADNTASLNTIVGHGSSMGQQMGKKIHQIAKHGISTALQSALLLHLCNQRMVKKALELGTSLGINALIMSRGESVEKVTTIEGNVELALLAQKHFDSLAHDKIDLMIGDISKQLDLLRSNNQSYDLIYIDANHTYEATLTYYHQLLPLTNHNTILVFDDINWSPEMTQAWNKIISFDTNSLTIENFHLGIVFLNPDLEHHNYVLEF